MKYSIYNSGGFSGSAEVIGNYIFSTLEFSTEGNSRFCFLLNLGVFIINTIFISCKTTFRIDLVTVLSGITRCPGALSC